MADACDLILITGFLGAGKTTLLRKLLRMYSGERIHMVINEFGAVNVDGVVLEDLGATMDAIINGSIFCACRMDQFEAALDRAQEQQPDLLLVEASGLSDPTAIRTIVEQHARYPGIRYRGCIALADATSIHRVIHTARVCHRQLSVADLILLTKTDLATAQQLEAAETLLTNRYYGVQILHAVQGAVPRETVDALSAERPAQTGVHRRDLTLQKHSLTVSRQMKAEQLRAFLKMFAEDAYRIKGFVQLADGNYLADCVGAYIKLTPADSRKINQKLVVLAGEGMPLRKSLQEALSWYSDWVGEDGADT